MDGSKEADEDNISLGDESPPGDSAPSSPSPSADCPSAVTEEAVLENEGPDKENDDDGRDSPSLHPELAAGDSDDDNKPTGQATPEPRVISVTPKPASGSPDSGVRIDEDDEEEEDIPVKKDPPAAPSPVPSEASLRSMSPEPAKPPPRKGGSSQPPRFQNDVEPAGYRRPAPQGFNRAVGTMQCKAMLVIMAMSLVGMIVVVGYIIMQSDDEIAKTAQVSLNGTFNISNRPYVSDYAQANSAAYIKLSDEFTDAMNATFQSNGNYTTLYTNTSVDFIEPTGWDVSRPMVTFTLNLVVPEKDVPETGVNQTMTKPEVTTTVPVTQTPGPEAQPPLLTRIIGYLVGVADTDGFGNFTGQMTLTM